MKYRFVWLLLFIVHIGYAQIDPGRVTIARDSFGVPHVFAPTDAEAAYGLAWAHAEDDFPTLQMIVLSGKARLGKVLGRAGAEADYVINLLRCRQLVEDQWHTLGEDFLAVVRGYVQGLNDYARSHPKEVRYRKAFPFNEKEYMTAVVFSVAVFCGVDNALPKILSGKIPTLPGFGSQGSNAFAFHPSKTNTGEAFLTINAHQPLEGPAAFYEAHVQSGEGWNMLGGLLAGGCVILHGTNENLGWAHTVNYPDKIDIYQLEMNPKSKNKYRFDGEWLALEVKKAKLKVKGIPITIGKKVYWSKYGPTVKTRAGVFSMRLPALTDIRMMEQWYRMNKARNFTEFYKAISVNSLPMFNIVYADRHDTIFYVSNVKMPVRNPDPQYDWQNTLPGNTSATLWSAFRPYQELPQYINPSSGYLFNTNHSPFLASASTDNLDPKKFAAVDGYEQYHNNRSIRVTELLDGKQKVDYDAMKRIKFDRQLPAVLYYPYGIDTMLSMQAEDYPELASVITALQQWDRKAGPASNGAAVFLLAYHYVAEKLHGEPPRQLTFEESIATYTHIRDFLLLHYNSTNVALGDVQKLVRGDDARPGWGLPDVLAAAYSEPYKDGVRKITSGDAYICFVRYPKTGLPLIESVNTFGASSSPASPHYKDQMSLFQNQQTKKMTLDKEAVLKSALRVYSPGR